MKPPEAIGDDETALRKSEDDGLARTTAKSAPNPSDDLQVFDLHALIDDATGPLTAAAAEKDLAIQVKTADDLPRDVVGAADGIRTVLAGLLENAVTFTERGEIVASVTSRETGSGRAIVHFEISDTGPGFPADTVNGSATGGLERARRLVERMDGRMACASAAGLGSTICFDVPVDLSHRSSG